MLGRRRDQGVMCPESRISLLAHINQLVDSVDLGSAGKHSLPRDLNYPGNTQDTQMVNYGALPLATPAFFTSSPSYLCIQHMCVCVVMTSGKVRGFQSLSFSEQWKNGNNVYCGVG